MVLDDLKKIVELQHNFNTQVDNDYLEKRFNWTVAIIAEIGELLESTNYKWWKKTEIDINNIQVETIDILHFLISDFIQFAYDSHLDPVQSVKRVLETVNIGKFTTSENLTKDIIDIIFALNQILFRKDIGFESYIRFATNIFLNLANTVGIDLDDILNRYITKNALNKIRNTNGYTTGTYKKIWAFENEQVEDNVAAYKLISKQNIKTIDNAVKILQDYYNQL